MNKIIKKNIFLKATTEVLFQRKMEDICLIDLRTISNLLVDYLLIGTSHSETQMNGALSEIKKVLSKKGVKKIRFDNGTGSRWGVLDSEEVVVHLFEAKTREFYSLERLWVEGSLYKIDLEEVVPEIKEDDEQFI